MQHHDIMVTPLDSWGIEIPRNSQGWEWLKDQILVHTKAHVHSTDNNSTANTLSTIPNIMNYLSVHLTLAYRFTINEFCNESSR